MPSHRIRTYVASAASLLAIGLLEGPAVGTPPRAATDPSAAAPTSTPRPTASAIRAEIDRVVAEGRTVSTRAAAGRQVAAAVRCAEFLPDARYCLGYGWTERSEAEVQADVTGAIQREQAAGRADHTGDLSVASSVGRATARSAAARAAADRRELTDGARGIDKYLALRDDLTTTDLAAASYPESGRILKNRVSEQTRSYWCGPTSMQMIHWNWGSNSRVAQSTWASRLGTTTSGSAITALVHATNKYTSWDRDDYADTYITLDISGYTYNEWWWLNVKHYASYRAPVILHPILLKKYYPYLDDNGSGHFQVGRGWDNNSTNDDPRMLGYYEPWNQQRFNASEPFIPRVQWRWAKNSYLANKAHFQHNLGL